MARQFYFKFMSDYQHLPIYHQIYQFIKFLYAMVINFPKQYKYTLGEDILSLSWGSLDLVLKANSLPNESKYQKIKELSEEFDKLKIRIRMAQELNLISAGQFAHIQTYYVKETGGMIGGWLNWSMQFVYHYTK